MIFHIPEVGSVAGCMVTDGKIVEMTAKVMRDGEEICSGKLSTLKRIKDDAREVSSGTECGLTVDGYKDIQVGDLVEVYESPSSTDNRLNCGCTNHMNDRSFKRTSRVSSNLRRDSRGTHRSACQDPRVSTITVTDVEVTGDLREARVYFLGPLDRIKMLISWQAFSGIRFLRREVGRRIRCE